MYVMQLILPFIVHLGAIFRAIDVSFMRPIILSVTDVRSYVARRHGRPLASTQEGGMAGFAVLFKDGVAGWVVWFRGRLAGWAMWCKDRMVAVQGAQD